MSEIKVKPTFEEIEKLLTRLLLNLETLDFAKKRWGDTRTVLTHTKIFSDSRKELLNAIQAYGCNHD